MTRDELALVIEKIELAVRRAIPNAKITFGPDGRDALQQLADELTGLLRSIRDAEPSPAPIQQRGQDPH